MIDEKPRASANLAMLEFMARKLGALKDDFVFLGGCATVLLVTDRSVPDLRTTLDVDCVVDVISLVHYHKIEKRLMKQGFKKSMNDDVICRWRFDDMILDVMPTDEKILGFGNRWYKTAIEKSVKHEIADGLIVKSVSAPYFLGTKFEAFRTRGNNDFLLSHDFEDIITIVDGRIELFDEFVNTDSLLKRYLVNKVSDTLNNREFHLALPGHLANYGLLADERMQIVLDRLEKIANLS